MQHFWRFIQKHDKKIRYTEKVSILLSKGSSIVYYRRKILLALLEAFGGSLAKTDCQKLLFLFCLRRRKNYYDFFPYKYGGFSFILYQDKSRLADLSILSSQDNFQLEISQSYFDQLRAEDRVALDSLVREVGDLRGEELIRKVYLEYPYYASRSEIAERILEPGEYEKVSQVQNGISSSCLFTIGYEGLSIDAYLNILLANNIAALVDVRKNPLSMKYGFSKTKLTNYSKLVNIAYFHISDLGVPSDLRKDLNSPAAYQKLFEYYCSDILPGQGAAVERLKVITNAYKRVAITCFEADHKCCHRHKIAECLENDPGFDMPVIHLNKNFTSDTRSIYNRDASLSLDLWNVNESHSSVGR